MMKWTMVCAATIVAGLYADRSAAQEPIAMPATVISSSQPLVVTPTVRVGLFGRMRERRGMVTPVNGQVIQAQAVMSQGPITEQVIQAQALTPSTATNEGQVIQAQALVPQTTPMATQAQSMETIVLPAQAQVMETRQGLLGRLRMRRGW